MSERDESYPTEHDKDCDGCGKNVSVPGIDKHEENPAERDDVFCDLCLWKNSFDAKKISNTKIDGVDTGDVPDFCDAYIESGDYDGEEMTEAQLEALDELCPELINTLAYESLI